MSLPSSLQEAIDALLASPGATEPSLRRLVLERLRSREARAHAPAAAADLCLLALLHHGPPCRRPGLPPPRRPRLQARRLDDRPLRLPRPQRLVSASERERQRRTLHSISSRRWSRTWRGISRPRTTPVRRP